jgi:hypothetical protein
VILAPIAALVFTAGTASAVATTDLDRGVQLFNDFEDAKAEVALRAFVASAPPPVAAQLAKAHLYLGLIAFQALDADRARTEFSAAVKQAPAIELPFGVSPKARLLFEQVQRETIEQEARAKANVPPARPRTEVPAQAAPPPPENPSRAPAYVLGAIGLAGLAAGGVFGALCESDLSTSKDPTIGVSNAAAKNSSAGAEGLAADIAFAAGGALALTAVFLWFAEAPHDTQAVVTPLPSGGATLEVLGRF